MGRVRMGVGAVNMVLLVMAVCLPLLVPSPAAAARRFLLPRGIMATNTNTTNGQNQGGQENNLESSSRQQETDVWDECTCEEDEEPLVGAEGAGMGAEGAGRRAEGGTGGDAGAPVTHPGDQGSAPDDLDKILQDYAFYDMIDPAILRYPGPRRRGKQKSFKVQQTSKDAAQRDKQTKYQQEEGPTDKEDWQGGEGAQSQQGEGEGTAGGDGMDEVDAVFGAVMMEAGVDSGINCTQVDSAQPDMIGFVIRFEMDMQDNGTIANDSMAPSQDDIRKQRDQFGLRRENKSDAYPFIDRKAIDAANLKLPKVKSKKDEKKRREDTKIKGKETDECDPACPCDEAVPAVRRRR